MSEEKTEEPTEKKLEDARKKGMVAKSADLVSAISLTGVFILLIVFWPNLINSMLVMMQLSIDNLHQPFEVAFRKVLSDDFKKIVVICALVAGPVVFLVILAHVLQFGFLFSAHPITPKFEKVNPVEGFKRIFSLNTLIRLIKSTFKMVFLGILFYITIKRFIPSLALVSCWDLKSVGALTMAIMFRLLAITIVVFLALGIIDVLLQKWLHIRKNKMTKDEVKREYKEMEGDPLLKGARTQFHQELIEGYEEDRSMRVARVTLVIAAPDDIAVALFYHPTQCPLPKVIAKERYPKALDIQAEARETGAPVCQNAGLAKRIFMAVDLNSYISRELFEPVAALIKSTGVA